VATIRQRNGKWQVQVRRRGHPTITRTFCLKADGVRWFKLIEVDVDRRGVPQNAPILRTLSLGDLLRRFRDEHCPLRHGCKVETVVINAFLRSELSDRRLFELSPHPAELDV
jgi:hypothetical protein